jgi:hypothetical protein
LAQRAAKGDWTEAEVLIMASRRDFVVHKYRDSQAAVRKLTRRMYKDGKLDMVLFDGRQFYYRVPGTYKKEDYDDET